MQTAYRILFAISLSAAVFAAGRSSADSVGQMQEGVLSGEQAYAPVLPSPPQLSPEQQQKLEDALAHTHLPGPPLPVTPSIQRQSPELPATPPPAQTPRVQLGDQPGSLQRPNGASPPESPPAPGSMTYFRTKSQAPPANLGADVLEPSVGSSGGTVFMSANWYAAISTDGGANFGYVDPFKIFPAIDGGFCCDMTVTYDRTRDLFAWSLQYIKSGSTSSDKGSWRTAFATSANAASGNWCYYTWSPASFGLPATGYWLDYPEVALTNTYIYYTVNVFTTTNDTWFRTLFWRIPLDQAKTCSPLPYQWFVVSDHFTFTPVQGATSTMYFMSHTTTSSLRIYSLADNSGSIFMNDVSVTTWFDATRSCPAPNGANWCGRADGSHGSAGWVAGGVIGFMWSSSGNGGSRPFPYIRVARFDETTKALINEPDIWNSSIAWIYNAVAINDRGALAGVVFWGGGGNYPNMAAIIWDDLSSPPPPWENYFVVGSGNAKDNEWGDFYAARRHGSYGNTWVITGEEFPAGATSRNVNTWYVWLGRQRDAPPRIAHDFNGDGLSDVLWRNALNGNGLIWFMNGVNVTSGQTLGMIPLAWTVAGTGDFNGDGKTDILWRSNAGDATIWFMNGGQIVSASSLGNIPLAWSVAGIADFDGDGNADILWRNSSGDVAIWLLNGGIVKSGGGLGNVPTVWTIVGTGDFNGDGKGDILWRNTMGDLAMWFMNGLQIASGPGLGNVPTAWTVSGVADFNGDAKADILWRNTSGDVAMWLMNGAQIASGAGVGNVPTAWSIIQTPDFNGDHKGDILWRNSGGDVTIWLMNGAQILFGQGLGNVPTDWSIQAVNAD